jgi:uncharacterized protein (TIGR02646 family)
MMRWARGPAPAVLTKWEPELTVEFVLQRTREPTFRFQWRQRDGVNLGTVVREALEEQNHGHCSYCDAYPLDASGRKEVDHFRPKSRFPELAYAWHNLYLVCTACNLAKRERWCEALLRSDAEDYSFHRYFEVDGATGAIAPNRSASGEEQERAARTIEVFDLNTPGRRIARRKAILRPDDGSPFHERAYRFLYFE